MPTRWSAATPRPRRGTSSPPIAKWYRNWAITRLLIEQLEDMALQWPEPDFDVDEERRRLKAIP